MVEFGCTCVVPLRAMPELSPEVTNLSKDFQKILYSYTVKNFQNLITYNAFHSLLDMYVTSGNLLETLAEERTF